MIRCPNCDTEAVPGSRFCSGCGQSLYRTCSACEQEVGMWMAFCPFCGARAEASGASDSESGDSRVQLASVLFGDVKGFTAMSEHLSPEEVTGIMNACFEALSQAIVQYGGSVDKYVGDAIMARFGWPQAHEDDPVRAIHAGLEMQRRLRKFADNLKATRGFELAMRIGINTGQVFAARVGGDLRDAKFTLMGNTVNLASRLEHEAEPGSILAGETTYRLARHAFEFEAMEPMEIRGQSEPINAFVPLRPKTGVAGSRAERSERQLRLVGREAEMACLDKYLLEAGEGSGRLVALVADPGLGKSRMVEEFWKRHLDEGLSRVYAAAPSFGESMPYSMLSSFSRSLLFGEGVDREVSEEELREKLTTLLPPPNVSDAVVLLDELLGIERTEETEISNLEARSRQAMLTNVLKILLAARSQQQPLLLNLEDMHWVDSASLDVLEPILTGIQNLPVLALLTHRPQFQHSWASKGFYREIKLLDLPRENARSFLEEFFGSHAIPAAVGERVIEKAGGNPFFLEQLLNNLIQSEAIVQRNGKWVLIAEIDNLTVPDTIQEILQARIDQLPRLARGVLEIASVIGRVFMHRLLKAVVDTDRNLDDHLQLLQQHEFISEKSLLPELEYMFTHALTQDVAYSGVPEARRRVLHERVAESIEALGIEQLPLLAVHYEKTENRGKALEYALAAAERSRQLYANQDAISHFAQALEILEGEPEGVGSQRLYVLEALGDIHDLLAEFEQAHDCYVQARDEIEAQPSDLARLWRKLGDLAESSSRYAEAQTCYREAERALEDADDVAEQVHVWLAMARMYRSRGVLESASTICLRALALASAVDDATSASLYFELGEIERERGHLVGASGYLAAASSTWDQLGALEKQALVNSALGDVAANRGELVEAMTYFEKALETQSRVLDRQGMASTLYGIGRIKLAAGQLDESIDCYEQALAMATEIGNRLLAANCMVQLATIHLEQGNIEQAQRLINGWREGEGEREVRHKGAYNRFKEIRNWRGAAHALVARARLERAQGDPFRARHDLKKAMNLATEMDDPWLQAQVHINQAEMEEDGGALDVAATGAQAGISMARDLSDPRLVARGERVLGRIRAKQGRMKEALELLASSVDCMRRTGAIVYAARAALDYAIVAQSLPNSVQSASSMLDFALQTFEQSHSTRDLQVAQAVAQQIGRSVERQPSSVSRQG